VSGGEYAAFPVFPAGWTAKPDWSGDSVRSLDDSLDDSLESAAEAAPSALASPRRCARQLRGLICRIEPLVGSGTQMWPWTDRDKCRRSARSQDILNRRRQRERTC